MSSLISILIPVYNPDISKFEECLMSIRNQGIFQPEIIIGMQGETDITNLVKKYKCRLIHFDKPSLYKTRIKLIPYVDSKYVWYVDCDDRIAKSSLDNLIAVLEKFKTNKPDIICFKSSNDYKLEKN